MTYADFQGLADHAQLQAMCGRTDARFVRAELLLYCAHHGLNVPRYRLAQLVEATTLLAEMNAAAQVAS